MNKTFFAAIVAIFFVVLSTSCTNYRSTGPGVAKTVTADTVLTDPIPVLGDRFDCNGKLLPEQKVTNWLVNRKLITITTVCGLSNDELNGLGYFYKAPHDSVMNPNFWERRSFGELLVLGFLAGLLIGLLLRAILNRPNTNTPPAGPEQPIPPAPVKNQANLLTSGDMTRMLEALGKNGGEFSTSQDGSFSLTLNPAKDETEQVKSPEAQVDKTPPTQTIEEVKPAQ